MGKNETGAAGQRRRRTEPHGRDAHPAGRPRPPGRRAGVHRDGEREPTLVTGQRTGDPWRRGNPAAGASRRRPSGRSAQPRQWHGAASPAGVLVLHGSERAASARSADVVERLVEQERHTGAEAGPEGRILPSILVEDSFTARGRRNRRERIRDSQAKQLRTQAVTRTAPKPFPRPFPQRPDRALCATPNPVDPHHASGRTRRFPDAVPTPVGPSLHPSATRPPPVRVPRAPTSNAPRAFRPSPRPPRGGLEQKRAGWLNPKHARGLASEPGRIRLPRIGARPLPKSPAATSSRSSPPIPPRHLGTSGWTQRPRGRLSNASLPVVSIVWPGTGRSSTVRRGRRRARHRTRRCPDPRPETVWRVVARPSGPRIAHAFRAACGRPTRRTGEKVLGERAFEHGGAGLSEMADWLLSFAAGETGEVGVAYRDAARAGGREPDGTGFHRPLDQTEAARPLPRSHLAGGREGRPAGRAGAGLGATYRPALSPTAGADGPSDRRPDAGTRSLGEPDARAALALLPAVPRRG